MNAPPHEFLPEEVMAFLDGELSSERAAAFSTHLGTCSDCSALATNHSSLSQRMTDWHVGPPPGRLTERITSSATANRAKGEPASSRVPKRRDSPVFKWAVGIASGLAALVVLIAIGTPNLLRSRMAANEASAVGSLRTLNTAASVYLDAYGHYPLSLRSLGPSSSGVANEEGAMLIDSGLTAGQKSGYSFSYRTYPGFGASRAGTYKIQAGPLDPDKSGFHHFSTDQTGEIFMNGLPLGGGTPPTADASSRRTEKIAQNGQSLETGPMIARTAELSLAVQELDRAREGMDRILTHHKGYIAQLSVNGETSSAHTLTASLRIPADQLDGCLAELKKLGRVIQESQAGEEVTRQHADLIVRLKNAHTTETRLNDVIQQRTGKVADILEVEKESARVRGEIEQMEAEQKALEHRVDFATIDLKLAEEYKAQLSTPAPSVWMQLRNASINGFRNAFENLLGIVLFLAESGPTLLLWLAILGIPALEAVAPVPARAGARIG